MSEAIQVHERDWMQSVFRVVWEPSTYLKILYLLLALPLGTFYFVFLVTGFALGVGLLIVWIGFPILLLVILAVYGLTGFERLLAIHLLPRWHGHSCPDHQDEKVVVLTLPQVLLPPERQPRKKGNRE